MSPIFSAATPPSDGPAISRPARWTSGVLFAVAVFFLLFDGVTKLFAPPPVVEAFARLGIPLRLAAEIGVLQLACLTLYVIPRTAVLGAVLLAAYLGGAVAIHVRAGSPLFEKLFPVLVAAFAWGALYLRDRRVRELVPLRTARRAGGGAAQARS